MVNRSLSWEAEFKLVEFEEHEAAERRMPVTSPGREASLDAKTNVTVNLLVVTTVPAGRGKNMGGYAGGGAAIHTSGPMP